MNIKVMGSVLGALMMTVSIQARTWTSVSGATIEADFLRKERDQVILQNAQGKMFRINLSLLSKADRDHVVELTAPAKELSFEEVIAATKGAESPPAEVKKPEPPRQPPKAEPEPDKPEKPKLFTYEEVPPLPSSTIPGLKLKKPDDATYYGLQFGPSAQDVIYFAFDILKEDSPADYAYVYSPSIPAYKRPLQVKARKKSFLDEKANTFGPFLLNTAFNDLRVQIELTMGYGYKKWWMITPLAEVKFMKGGVTSEVILVAWGNDDLTMGEGDIQAAPLLQDPVLSVTPKFNKRYQEVELDARMGKYRINPGRGMGDEFELVFNNEEGKKVGNEDIKLEEEKALDEHPYRYKPEKLKDGMTYTLVTTLDMGRVFGPLVVEETFETPKKEEDEKKK